MKRILVDDIPLGELLTSSWLFKIIPSDNTKKAFMLEYDLIVPAKDYSRVKTFKSITDFENYLKEYADKEGKILYVRG
ncbi:hypothetical protein LCGC14_3001010 [marine sediment metagenome]|uniref:Uncharacterized protein n=1 Tax=marine sediment metagenome TaxID=412755 RepID=A0A0F8Z8M2_9ZZZZ